MVRCSLAELAGMINQFIELIQVRLIQTLTFGAPVLFVKEDRRVPDVCGL
jgi:hypothetical protein